MARYIVISPDGFTIHPEETYSSKRLARIAFESWKTRYNAQGYYSSVPFGRIPLPELHLYCSIQTV